MNSRSVIHFSFMYLFIHLFAFEEKGLTAKQWKSIDPVILEFDWMLHFNQSNFSMIFKSIIISFTLGFWYDTKVNKLIIQGSFGETEFHGKVHSLKRKRSWLSFSPTSCAPEINYRYSKRIGPMAVSFAENKASDFILNDSNKHHFLWTLLRYKANNFRIPSWTAFQISISNGIPLLKNKHRLSRLHRFIGCRNVNHLSGMLVFVQTFDIFLIAFGNRSAFLTKHVVIFELLNCIVMM